MSRILDTLQADIAGEMSELRSSGDRIAACAAFAFEAMEDGGDVSPKIDRLERDLADNERRTALLKRQELLVAGMRSRLDAFLSRQGNPG